MIGLGAEGPRFPPTLFLINPLLLKVQGMWQHILWVAGIPYCSPG